MSQGQLERLFMLACELKPDLPDRGLMALLGKTWNPIITAAAEHGLAGAASALPTASVDQLSRLYMAGAETGAAPSIEEFRATLAGRIYEAICGNDNISQLDQIKLAGKLGKWFEGRGSTNGEEEMDFDAKVDTPPFTKSGFWPFDDLHSSHGMPQEICTVLSRPGVGKTTMALATAKAWRENSVGSVVLIQTEIAPSALRMKIDAMCQPGLFRSGVDRLVFGRRNAQTMMQRMIENPDPDRLVLFDSVTGFCGQGDGPESRTRFAELYDDLCQVKNNSRTVMAFSHVKRGTDLADIESAAGSSAVERFSGSLIYLSADDTARPDGLVAVKAEILKNRYGSLVRPKKFLFDYVTGAALADDPLDEIMEGIE